MVTIGKLCFVNINTYPYSSITNGATLITFTSIKPVFVVYAALINTDSGGNVSGIETSTNGKIYLRRNDIVSYKRAQATIIFVMN